MDGELLIALIWGLASGFALSFAVGLVVGFFSGLLGIGGGTMLIPTFKLGFAMDAIASTATSLFTIVPTSLAGFVTHARNGTCIPKVGVAAGLAGAVTSPLGVWLASRSQDWMIMAAAAVIIGYTSFTMLRKALHMPKGQGAARVAETEAAAGRAAAGEAAAGEATATKVAGEAAAGKATATKVAGEGLEAAPASAEEASAARVPAAPTPSASVTLSQVEVTPRVLVQAALIGLVAGVASGYVGVGGGFLMVPLFIRVLGTPMKLTSGTSLIAVMILAVPGVAYQAALGNIDWVAGIAVALGSVPGAMLGARFMPRVPERTLRLLFGCFLLFAAIMLLANQVA